MAVDQAPRLSLRGISKRFGGVRAIRSAEIDIAGRPRARARRRERRGQVHPDQDRRRGRSRPTPARSSSRARRSRSPRPATRIALGIADRLPGTAAVPRADRLGEHLHRPGNPQARTGRLGRAERQGARAARAARPARPLRDDAASASCRSPSNSRCRSPSPSRGDAKVLILDEPSAILTDAEIDVLFAVVRRLTASGVAVIYISHRLDELFRIADEVTVMRDGADHRHLPDRRTDVRKIAELMVGGILSDERRRARHPRRRARAGPRRPRARRASSTTSTSRCGRGEIVAPLRARRLWASSEIAACLYGIDRPTSGAMRLRGTPIAPRSPHDAQRHGIAMLPANRKVEGMFSFQSIAFNISAGHLNCCRGSGCSSTARRETRGSHRHDQAAGGADAARAPADQRDVRRQRAEGRARPPARRAPRSACPRRAHAGRRRRRQGGDPPDHYRARRQRAPPCSSPPPTCPRRCGSPTGCSSCAAAPPPSSSPRTPRRSTCSRPPRVPGPGGVVA